MNYQDPRKRTFPEDNYQPRTQGFRGASPSAHSSSAYATSDYGRVPPKRGRGKGINVMGEVPFTPTTEHRIPVDMSAFPSDANVIMQLLGPRGKHQQRMKNESDTIVTTSGKGARGPLMPGEEPLSLVLRSKDPSVPLTRRQVTVVHQIYEDIIRHVKEFGNSDNAASGPLSSNEIPPMSLIEFLWNLHMLLSRPRPSDLRVEELHDAYFDMFGHDCPLSSWLVVDPGIGGVQSALSRIPHVVELYQSGPAWFMRPANPPDTHFAQLREADDAYKIRLQQIAAGHIPIEDLGDAKSVTGMLFGLDRVSACTNILQAVVKVVSEKNRHSSVGLDMHVLQAEFHELYKVPLDVYHLINEKSLVSFLAKFKPLLNVYNDGMGWKVILTETWAEIDVESLVKATILVQPRPRRVVSLCNLIPLPVAAAAEPEYTDEAQEGAYEAPLLAAGTDSVSALMSLLQGFQKPAPASEASTVTAQIQQLLQKKKQQEQSQPQQQPAASGTALNELMAALQAAKHK